MIKKISWDDLYVHPNEPHRELVTYFSFTGFTWRNPLEFTQIRVKLQFHFSFTSIFLHFISKSPLLDE